MSLENYGVLELNPEEKLLEGGINVFGNLGFEMSNAASLGVNGLMGIANGMISAWKFMKNS